MEHRTEQVILTQGFAPDVNGVSTYARVVRSGRMVLMRSGAGL
jgi:hypothetical protein